MTCRICNDKGYISTRGRGSVGGWQRHACLCTIEAVRLVWCGHRVYRVEAAWRTHRIVATKRDAIKHARAFAKGINKPLIVVPRGDRR